MADELPPIVHIDDDVATLPPLDERKKKPGILDKAGEYLGKAFTPLADVTPQMKQAMEETSKEHPYVGILGRTLTGAMTGMSSPAALALEAGSLGTAGIPASLAARGLRTAGKVMGAGAITQGAYNTGKNIYAGKYPEAVGSALEMGIGALPFIHGGPKIKLQEPPPEVWAPKPKVPLQLGPAPPEIANPPRFIAGPTGKVAPAAQVTPEIAAQLANMGVEGHPQTGGIGTAMNPAEVAEQNRLRNLNFNAAQQFPGTRLELPNVQPPIPPVSGDTRGGFAPQTGGEMPYPYNVLPNRVRPRTAQSEVLSTTGLGHVEPPVKPMVPEPPVERITEPPPIDENARPEYSNTEAIKEGEPILPSAVKKPKVKPITQTKAPGNVAPIIDAEIIPKSKPTVAPKQAVENWGYERNASKFTASEVRKQFADLEDQPDLVGKFQEGSREGRLKDVSDYFDKRFKDLVDAGVLDKEDYKENYLKQLWDNTPEEIDAAFNKIGIANKPGLSKESVFKSYKQGIGAGLTPKYDNITDIAAAFEHEANNAIADAKFKGYLKDKGIQLSDIGDLVDPKRAASRRFAKMDPEAQAMVTNYFGKSPDLLNKVANAIGVSKNIVLSQGLPSRSGTVSAHGINLLDSDMMARGFGPAIKDFVSRTVSPEKDVEFIQQNKGLIKKAIESGLNWSGDAYSTGTVNDAIKRIPLIGKVKGLQEKLLENPLFSVRAPAMQLKQYITRFNQLAPKIGEDEAARQAAKFANDFSGTVNKTFKNKTMQDIARIGLLAPDWLGTRYNITTKGLSGKPGYVAPALRGAALTSLPAVAGIAAKGLPGYLSSKPAEVTGIPAGVDAAGKQRNVEPLGTSVEPGRGLLQMGTQLSQGNLTEPFKYLIKNKLSPPLRTLGDLMYNQDVYEQPISGKGRYNQPISTGEAAGNVAEELTRPITPSPLQAAIDLARSKGSTEEVAARALGLPLTYTTKPKGKKPSTSLGRLK